MIDPRIVVIRQPNLLVRVDAMGPVLNVRPVKSEMIVAASAFVALNSYNDGKELKRGNGRDEVREKETRWSERGV